MHNHDFRVLQQNAEDSSKACLLQPVDQMEVWHERSVNKNNFLCENNWKVKMWIRVSEELCCERGICSLFVVHEEVDLVANAGALSSVLSWFSLFRILQQILSWKCYQGRLRALGYCT
jgi:hypothetical protein